MNANLTVSPRMRVVAAALVVLILLFAVYKFVLSGGNKSPESAPATASATPTVAIPKAPTPAARAAASSTVVRKLPALVDSKSGPDVPKPVTKKPAPIATTVKPAPVVSLLPGLPPTVAAALGRSETVVVSLYTPNSAVDDIAAQEARAGAKRAGVAWVAVDVLKERDAAALIQKLDVKQDPAVLIFRRPGNLVSKIDGFADSDTVAQAASLAAR